jgi:hypothetical protein
MNEAFTLPLTQLEHKENISTTSDVLRGSYNTYIHNAKTYKRNTENSQVPSNLVFYQLKEQ